MAKWSTDIRSLSPNLQHELPEFNPQWYPALIQARKEYLLSRMAEIEQLSPPEALAAMDEFNEADLQLLGLKRIKIKDNK